MAKKTVVELVDDLGGGTADQTVQFSIDSVSYEIDLNAANASALRDALAEYVVAGRRTGGRRQTTSRSGSASRQDLDAVRAWARANGHDVADRGRVSKAVQDAYNSAH